MMNDSRLSFWGITLKTMVVHTITYFVMGLLAFVLLDYSRKFAKPDLALFMRQTDDPWVMAGPLFQPLRGILFGMVFFLLRDILFGRKNGWLVMWIMLVVVGILSTFGPSPGSIEGMIYTIWPIWDHITGWPEVMLQALLLSVILYYWVNHPEKKWLNWVLGVVFFLMLFFPALGLMIG